ncbi:MAG: GNAT family N-acetyltransferase [Proteobacteria bacterium]|nr:GNAT family N-acetyltransferase [Pseudomonadota bacterium]
MNSAWTDGELWFSYTQLEEIDEIGQMLAKESVCEHMFFGPNTLEETRDYFLPLVQPMQDAVDQGELPGAHVFTIRRPAARPDDRAFVGQCAALPVAYGRGNYVIGYQLDEPFWGQGYGTRACLFLIWYCFDVLAAHRLSGDCLASNPGSARIMEKCGFQREGAQRHYYHSRGRLHDILLYGLLRGELTRDLGQLRTQFRPVD